MSSRPIFWTALLVLAVALPACDDRTGPTSGEQIAVLGSDGGSNLEAGTGVDSQDETIHVGALNAAEGPAAAIGLPMAVGKRMLFERANADDNHLLPPGWTIELHEREHGYEAKRAREAYDALRDEVLFVATSAGAEPTYALRNRLEEDDLVAFPASLSSKMARHEYTPPVGPLYRLQAMRAAGFAAEQTDGVADIGVLYRPDSYGREILRGAERAAEGRDGVRLVVRHRVRVDQPDVAPAVEALRSDGVDAVVLGTLPPRTARLLKGAREASYRPNWIGASPSWSDRFFGDDPTAPKEVFENFHRASGLPFWDEDLPGMEEFLETYREYGSNQFRPDRYLLQSYVQGLVQLEILRRCIDAGTVTRERFLKEMKGVTNWNAGGFTRDMDLSGPPYVSLPDVRILRADLEDGSWDVAGDYRDPRPMR